MTILNDPKLNIYYGTDLVKVATLHEVADMVGFTLPFALSGKVIFDLVSVFGENALEYLTAQDPGNESTLGIKVDFDRDTTEITATFYLVPTPPSVQ